MKRVLRQDRMLLESLEEKYGTDAIASAIMAIANRNNGVDIVDERVSPQEAVLEFIRYIEGVRIRMRELHWEAERFSKHTLTDTIIGDLESFEDDIAEQLQGVCHFRLKVGAIVPTMTNQVELQPLLDELHEAIVQLCASLESAGDEFGGIVNELEDMMAKVSKWKYLETFK